MPAPLSSTLRICARDSLAGRPRLVRRLTALGAAGVTLVGVGAVAVVGVPGTAAAAAGDYTDPSLSVADRVTDLLGRMSVDDKVGQMVQGERGDVGSGEVTSLRLGSVLSGGGSAPANASISGWADMYDGFQRQALATPLRIPMLYGIDAVHGDNNVVGSTIFPHNIGLGAANDPDLTQRIGRATAEEVSATGIDWAFAPCLCVARNDRWGRTYESYGELPGNAVTNASIITGLQGSSLSASGSILATAKHFVADGGTTGGVDQGNAQISDAELRAVHLPPFREAVKRGVGSVMVSYSSINGVKDHGSSYLITDVLKKELGFTGFVVSDWAGIDQIDGAPGFSAGDVRQAFNAGMDMAMVPVDVGQFVSVLRSEVQSGRIPMSRVDDANRRILTKKFELGLFERPFADRTFASTVGSAAHRALAREAVRKSQVLLKNVDDTLPLKKTGKIFVAGKSADNLGLQAGGWTTTWQGSAGNTYPGTTILKGIQDAVGTTGQVRYSADGSGIDSSYTSAVAVVGETPYAEGKGDRPGSLGLDSGDLATIDRLKASGVPVTVVLVSGRTLDIADQVGRWDALLAAWLPGSEGEGVADVLFGAAKPTGKLSFTWMNSASQQPINDGDGKPALYPYGFGLTYPGTPTTPPTTPTTPPTTPTTPPTTQPTSPTPGGTLVGAASNRCIGPGTGSPVSAVLVDCSGAPSWTVSNGRVSSSGGCLAVVGGGTANGTRVAVDGCDSSSSQVWDRTSNGAIVHRASKRCLDVVKGGTAAGTPLQLWDCVGNPPKDNQRWSTGSATAPVRPGTVVGVGSQRCLNATGTANASPVVIADCTGGAAQVWTTSGGVLKNTASGRCLSVEGNSTSDGAGVWLYDCAGSTGQAWTKRSDGSLGNSGSGKCLDVAKAATANGSRLQIWGCAGGASKTNQRWLFG